MKSRDPKQEVKSLKARTSSSRLNLFYFFFMQFFADVREAEERMKKMQEVMKRKYTCDRSVTVTRLEDLLQDAAVSSSYLSCSAASQFHYCLEAGTYGAQFGPKIFLKNTSFSKQKKK